jgi:hypothetical protein
MAGSGPGTRKDVQELHSAWRTAFGRTGATLRHATGDDAYALAEAIDAHGLPDCLLVAVEAPKDGWVNGQLDDKKAKHESIRYIFGNEETFSRILAAANDRAAKRQRQKETQDKLAAAEAAERRREQRVRATPRVPMTPQAIQELVAGVAAPTVEASQPNPAKRMSAEEIDRALGDAS